MSRKDHRDYDAALQKLRNMEAAIKKPEGFQPKDIIAICLVAFTALALLPLAPKLGRGLTAFAVIFMVAMLWYPVSRLSKLGFRFVKEKKAEHLVA